MPPRKCPECARFLKNDLVDGLVDGPEPCPRCGAELTAPMFGLEAAARAEDVVAPAAPEPEAAPPAPPTRPVRRRTAPGLAVAPSSSADDSVRPPDLDPDAVGEPRDVLAGWDLPGSAPAPALDAGPMVGPLTLPEAGTAAGIGALVGIVLGGQRRGLWALLLALLGVAAAAATRAGQDHR
ncbi:MAG: hypothetical protein ACLGIR_04060 [Actinomycetes bacterium]